MTTRAIDPALTSAYETCRRMHRRHDPTYYWATRRLPEEIRPATHALYGYVRTADEIVDGPRRPRDPAARRAALDAWEAELQAGLASGRSPQPVVGALVDAGRRHRLPLGELRAYMGSMRIDCAPVRMETWDELVAYMDGSAGSVGRIMAPLLGAPGRAPGGGSWRRCWGCPSVMPPGSGGSGSPSSTPTSSATCARTTASTASTCPARTAAGSG